MGVISFEGQKNVISRKDFFTQAIYADSLRGIHSTGMFMVPLDKNHKDFNALLTYKRALPGWDFVNTPAFNFFRNNFEYYKFIIGHNRYTTKGVTSDRNAHPFKENHITLVHNGHLEELYNLNITNSWQIDVDSEVLTKAFAAHGYQASIPKIKGAAAAVWYDEQTDKLYLYRNTERPLFYAIVKGENTAFIASEQEMLHWLAWRNGLEISKTYYVEEHTVLSIKDNVKKYDIEEIKPEKPKPVAAKHYPVPYTGQHKSVNDLLVELNVQVGQIVKVTMEGMTYNHKKSRHGELHGRLLTKPYPSVIARGVEKDKFKGDKILKGRVQGVEYHHTYKTHVVRVTDLELTDEDDPASLIYEKPEGRVEQPPIEDLVDKSLTEDYLIGPLGYYISQKRYFELVGNGCVHCTRPISADMHTTLNWTRDSQPVCPDCKDTPGVREYIH